MKNRVSYCLPALGLLLLFTGCQTPPPPATPAEVWQAACRDRDFSQLKDLKLLTLQDAQRIAANNNPDYLAAFQAVNAARMAYYQSLAAYSPEIGLNFNLNDGLAENVQRRNPPELIAPRDNRFTTQTTLRGSWLLFDGLARELNALAARSDYRRTAALRDNVYRLLMRATAYAFYDVLLAIEEERIARSDIEFQQSNLKQAQSRYQSGHISKSDLLNFKILLNRAQCSLVIARNHYQLAVYALAALMGYPQGTLPNTLQFPPIDDQVDKLVLGIDLYLEQALNARPDLEALREARQIADYRRSGKVSAFFPVITLYGEAGYGTTAHNYGGYVVEHRAWNTPSVDYGVNADWQLFTGFARYNALRQYEYLAAEAGFQLDNATLLAINEVRAAHENLQTQAELAEYYRETLNWVFEQRQLINVEYWAGNVTITRLNEAQYELISAESDLAIVQVELKKAAAQLTAAVNGRLEGFEPVDRRLNTGLPLDEVLDKLEEQFQYREKINDETPVEFH
ncbi:TolC family protein [Victivallis sp. Marseille-Q1083]|uniref:TolC family protein n=1 Tax=Victivallis sp. Marseille-Q1083 TaxID=2717288 RepID=UPI00158A1ED2|nr:TolC family protein [Victivallis sp. Marseille-Q1083]